MKALQILLLLWGLFPGSIFANTPADIYDNKTFGLRLTKPVNWHFLTAQQHYDGLKRIDLEDKEVQKRIVKIQLPH